jgi:hypothetical protein
MGALLKRWEFWFGLVGVFGAIFAVFAYVETYKVGRISYIFDTQKVFDPANLSGFTLVTPDKIFVEKPVYATEAVIWNSGDLSLSDNSDRIREPLTITISNSVIFYHILGAHNLVDDSNYTVTDSPDKSTVTVRWKFFDPGQGVRITVVHSESGMPNIVSMAVFLKPPWQKKEGLLNQAIYLKTEENLQLLLPFLPFSEFSCSSSHRGWKRVVPSKTIRITDFTNS